MRVSKWGKLEISGSSTPARPHILFTSLGCATCSVLSNPRTELRTVLAVRVADRAGSESAVARAFVQVA